MYSELSISINENHYKILLQRGFYSLQNTQSTHKHGYSEVHVISGGPAYFRVEQKTFKLNDSDMIIIPKGVFHSWSNGDGMTRHTAFQTDAAFSRVEVISLDRHVACGFFEEIGKAERTRDHRIIATYIPLLMSYADTMLHIPVFCAPDEVMLIDNFFSTYYNKNARLKDLAKILHLSERQTERKVLEHTGRTFKKELAASRIAVAQHLMSTTDMSLSDIAQYVGYGSYAGFWKAMKKGYNE